MTDTGGEMLFYTYEGHHYIFETSPSGVVSSGCGLTDGKPARRKGRRTEEVDSERGRATSIDRNDGAPCSRASRAPGAVAEWTGKDHRAPAAHILSEPFNSTPGARGYFRHGRIFLPAPSVRGLLVHQS